MEHKPRHTISADSIAYDTLPRTGYCQVCGAPGARLEIVKLEPVVLNARTVQFRPWGHYACNKDHLGEAFAYDRPVFKARLHEQWLQAAAGSPAIDPTINLPGRDVQQELAAARQQLAGVKKGSDWYCWFCGTHGGARVTLETRCGSCGELLNLPVAAGDGPA
jgi:hypothetical protein